MKDKVVCLREPSIRTRIQTFTHTPHTASAMTQRAFHQNKDLDYTASILRFPSYLISESLPSEQGFRLSSYSYLAREQLSQRAFHQNKDLDSRDLLSQPALISLREPSIRTRIQTECSDNSSFVMPPQRAFHQNKDLDTFYQFCLLRYEGLREPSIRTRIQTQISLMG